MNHTFRNAFHKIAFAVVGLVVATVAVLWSWNTLAPLFGGPTAQFRHALALVIALAALRVGLGSSAWRRHHKVEPEIRS
jgi:hypothetical protein